METKELVRLRKKVLKDGSESLYLDIYENGQRTYEFLKLYLRPGNDPLTRARNKTTMQAAKVQQAKRTIEVQNGLLDIKNYKVKSITFVEYAREFIESKALSDTQHKVYINALKRWIDYNGEKTLLIKMDAKLLRGFTDYLLTTVVAQTGKPLCGTSARKYFDCIGRILDRAVKEEYIRSNPEDLLEPCEKPQIKDVPREYLTFDELERLAKAECPDEMLKKAFMFSCFTGLRKSDVMGLRWWMIADDTISMMMKKTDEMIYVPLSENAKAWLPERHKNATRVYYAMSDRQWGRDMKAWLKAAGINKRITFHCARHTFATMLLTYGADITVISKLLGHHNLATTMIYAKIIDKRKVDAVNMIPKM